GIGQYGFHTTKALERSGVLSRITVLAGAETQNKHTPVFEQAEIDYCWQPNQLKTRQILLSKIKELNPDLVWLNLGASAFGKSPLVNLSGMLTSMQVRQMGYPTVVTLHELVELADLKKLNAPGGILAPLGAKILTKVATRADLVCLTMQHYKDWLSARKVNCVYIPIGSYQKPELLEEVSEQELLFFTTLAPFKGLDLLLEAFGNLKKIFPSLRLTIAGAEHTRFPGYGKKLKKSCDLDNGIQWLGQVPEEQVKELFRKAQIVILPYTASTGSSSVLCQSATWGRAIIASDLNEHVQLVNENNLSIQFFRAGDVKSLTDTIKNLLDDPAIRQNQITHNFNSIQKLTPKITAHQYIQAFNLALKKCRSKKRIPVAQGEMDIS
ncbi:MAG: glycosyltransferase, partial [Anaerolineales bacterium]